MIELTTAQWNLLLATYLYPFVRVMGYISADPVLGNRSVPVRLKVGLALAISVAIAPALPPLPPLEPASPIGLAILAQQMLIGVAIGFAVRVIFAAVEMAGQVMGLQMGLGFATFFDPQTSAQVPVIGQYLGLMSVLVFLSINGHSLVLSTLIESFRILPIGTLGFDSNGFAAYARWGAQIFLVGFTLAVPVIATLLIANFGIGIISRAAPQMNIFAVGFPFILLVGFASIYLMIPYFLPILDRLFSAGVETLVLLLRSLAIAPPR
ncbi:MAG: flagellar biosynthetic protein FliR [Betaproteobacteria bacterium]|nr:flagellar biosynthetic protein FliR [Betaproteobacteria bacterium]